MTLSEFKAWFCGYTERQSGVATFTALRHNAPASSDSISIESHAFAIGQIEANTS